MKQITIRGVEKGVHDSIKREADRRGMSMNRYLLQILRQAVGFGDGQTDQNWEFGDLDHLAGTWTSDEYERFERQLDSQRVINGELWQ
ncbi:MAG: hypothetical protein WA996_04080 [Candidatus Promineifilaceae bacterium]